MPQLADPRRTWTFEDLLDLLPEDVDPRSYEIVDGALHVTPSPGRQHEYVSARLRAAIATGLAADIMVAGPLGIDLSPSYRVPDLVVLPVVALERGSGPLRPNEVLAVVEVVSPGSRTTDRITKPAQYAAAGIPGFWRVETDPEITLTAYALDAGAGVYSELGAWRSGQTAEIERPFRIAITMDDLVPRA